MPPKIESILHVHRFKSIVTPDTVSPNHKRAQEEDEDENENEETLACRLCPACGSEETQFHLRGRSHRKADCHQCGHRWSWDPDQLLAEVQAKKKSRTKTNSSEVGASERKGRPGLYDMYLEQEKRAKENNPSSKNVKSRKREGRNTQQGQNELRPDTNTQQSAMRHRRENMEMEQSQPHGHEPELSETGVLDNRIDEWIDTVEAPPGHDGRAKPGPNDVQRERNQRKYYDNDTTHDGKMSTQYEDDEIPRNPGGMPHDLIDRLERINRRFRQVMEESD